MAENNLRQRKQNVLFGDDENVNTARNSEGRRRKKVTRCKVICTFIIPFLMVFGTIGMLYLYYHFDLDEVLSRYGREEHSVIIKMEVPIILAENLTIHNPTMNTYQTWEKYISTWKTCRKLNRNKPPRIKTDNSYLSYLFAIELESFVGNVTMDYWLDVTKLEHTAIAAAVHLSIRDSDFLIPAMYLADEVTAAYKGKNASMENYGSTYLTHLIQPCMCTLMINPELSSPDIQQIRTILPSDNALNMFNPDYHEVLHKTVHAPRLNHSPLVPHAQLTMAMLEDMRDEFWMEFPKEINVTFDMAISGSLITKSIMLRDPINIIHSINCIHFLQGTKYPHWHCKE